MPKTDQDLYQRLAALGIDHETTEHAPVFTVEESQQLRGRLDGAHIKNLFLRDRKKRMWLCTVLEDREIDLKALRKRLGAQGSLSFGAPDLLMEVLGVIPGSVTPLAVVNDTERQVTVVLDDGLFEDDLVNCHPLRNDRTTTLRGEDLLRFLRAEGYEPERIDFGQPLTDA
ncbi:MAG: prolyl-tRNA synthetase associated domain-containing protein [Alphaproteobacteria bacterium]|nr:prolyl-tRNA synthetase associated domain-containing protein [Alphaproteobacteria bacterium]MBO6864564.1 prolyl-tRNA synthetase associated domain-containing protein [Alphaproteobacteria bacterium]